MIGAIILLTFMYGLFAGAVLATMDKPKRGRKVSVRQKSPHFYDLRAE